MNDLFLFPSATKRDPEIEIWMNEHPGELGAIAYRWFEAMRACGNDVRELASSVSCGGFAVVKLK